MSTKPNEVEPLGDGIQPSVAGQTTAIAPAADSCLLGLGSVS